MSSLMIILTSISLVVLLAIAIYYFIQTKNIRRFILQLIIIGLVFAFLYLLFCTPASPAARGNGGDDSYFVIVLYFFMILGMLAQYTYARFSQPKRYRKKFEFGLFIALVFASPIIFIPLLSALQNANIDLLQLTIVKMMVFFVAFENGFFWKEYFDNRRKLKEEDRNGK
ncbi:MAG: hypothetical protein JSW07_05480 [bacterium]|nr:MAG: hypothetical protein JSW07_05480 [bacterium]